jgi:hypothetical protein
MLTACETQRNIARLFRLKAIKLVDGFDPDPQMPHGPRIWTEASYLSQLSECADDELIVPYFKLHGSLDWRDNEYGKTVELATTEEPPQTPGERELVIYPGEKCEPIREPYATSHRMLKGFLSKGGVVIVIGFSLRDSLILDYFHHALGQGTRFIFLDPADQPPDEVKRFVDVGPDDGYLPVIRAGLGSGSNLSELEQMLTRMLAE